MCDARLWRGGGGAIIDVLQKFTPSLPFDADLAHDGSIAAMAARTLAHVTGRLLPIGFSMGAIVAAEMWRQAPERIAGMILLGYNATADLPDRAAHRPLQQAEVLTGGFERVLVEELKPNYLAARNRRDPELLALLRDMGMALGPEVFVRQSEALRLRDDYREVLPEITVPVLLGCGDEDTLCPPAWHAKWAAQIADADLFTLAGTGHMFPLEDPLELAARIDCWLMEKEIR